MCNHLSSPFDFGTATSIFSVHFAALGSETEAKLQPPSIDNQKLLKVSGSTGLEGLEILEQNPISIRHGQGDPFPVNPQELHATLGVAPTGRLHMSWLSRRFSGRCHSPPG